MISEVNLDLYFYIINRFQFVLFLTKNPSNHFRATAKAIKDVLST